jgi:hypothetical protein
MAVFKVGDRVRIVSQIDAYTNGKTGSVVAADVRAWDSSCGFYRGYGVDVDGHPWDTVANDGCFEGYVFEGSELEPIQPERNRLVAWSDVPGGRPKVEEFA